MSSDFQIGVLALVIGGALVGSFALGKWVRGARALLLWPIWLATPFVVLALILSADIARDTTLSSQQASYNFSFGFVLIAILLAIPWLLANLIGWLVGRRFRKVRVAAASSARQ